MKSILTRRTIRKYANRDISDELLERLLTQAARTQSANTGKEKSNLD